MDETEQKKTFIFSFWFSSALLMLLRCWYAPFFLSFILILFYLNFRFLLRVFSTSLLFVMSFCFLTLFWVQRFHPGTLFPQFSSQFRREVENGFRIRSSENIRVKFSALYPCLYLPDGFDIFEESGLSAPFTKFFSWCFIYYYYIVRSCFPLSTRLFY